MSKCGGHRKARFVAGGHLTTDPGEDAYSGVIAPEAVKLGMFATVHNLQVLAAYNGNSYLRAKTREKLYTTLGEEYGSLRWYPAHRWYPSSVSLLSRLMISAYVKWSSFP